MNHKNKIKHIFLLSCSVFLVSFGSIACAQTQEQETNAINTLTKGGEPAQESNAINTLVQGGGINTPHGSFTNSCQNIQFGAAADITQGCVAGMTCILKADCGKGSTSITADFANLVNSPIDNWNGNLYARNIMPSGTWLATCFASNYVESTGTLGAQCECKNCNSTGTSISGVNQRNSLANCAQNPDYGVSYPQFGNGDSC